MVDTFIRRPILASVCSLVIILAGAIAIPTLPIAQFPELADLELSGYSCEKIELPAANKLTHLKLYRNPQLQTIYGLERAHQLIGLSLGGGMPAPR